MTFLTSAIALSFGSGHIQDMINRDKQNAALKNSRRDKFKGGNNYSNTKSIETEYDLPKPSNYKLSELKRKIKEEAKEEYKKRLLFWVFTVVIPLIIGFAIFLLY